MHRWQTNFLFLPRLFNSRNFPLAKDSWNTVNTLSVHAVSFFEPAPPTKLVHEWTPGPWCTLSRPNIFFINPTRKIVLEMKKGTEKAAEEAVVVRVKEDCFGCRSVGAGGCFAGAVYLLYQRSQLPKINDNRHWLAALAFGKATHGGWYKVSLYQQLLNNCVFVCVC